MIPWRWVHACNKKGGAWISRNFQTWNRMALVYEKCDFLERLDNFDMTKYYTIFLTNGNPYADIFCTYTLTQDPEKY